MCTNTTLISTPLNTSNQLPYLKMITVIAVIVANQGKQKLTVDAKTSHTKRKRKTTQMPVVEQIMPV